MLISTAPTVTDQQLIEQTLRGNSEMFGQLVRKYQDQLFTSIRHLSGSQIDAEDIVQEAFVQAYFKLATFHHRCAFYTWLYRIALNRLYSQGRRQRTHPSRLQLSAETQAERSDPHGTPADELVRREQAQHLGEALSALAEEHRTVLVLRGVEGFSYDTIATLLHLNPGTVRSRLHRARLQLRDQLQRLEHNPR
jgi:RNA polymerase sigma-70 factor (ECF subfamily)